MDIFQRNWEALRATRPALAAQMESMLPDPRYYRLIETPSGVPSLELTNAEGKTTLWHSRYEPIREVQRELQALDHSRIYVPLFGGLGLGYGLRALWNNYRDEFFDAIVLEPDPSIFRLAMQVTRLDDLFADPRLHLHLGTDLDAWAELVRRIIPAIMSSTVQYIPHRPSQQNHSPFFASALASLHQRIQLTQAEFDLMIKSGARIQDNLWDNLPRIVSSIGLSQVRGLLEGKPAIVIAAGPSLDKNVHRLRGQEHRFTLIAVDTAYRTLKQQGIDPHIVVTTDPTELNARHFEGIKPAPHTLLAFDPEVYSTIPISWPFRTLILNLEKTAFTRWIETILGPFGFLQKGGSVGHTAFYLAREFGADPIVFVGLDLAFDPQGGTTHSTASALYRAYSPILQGSHTADLGPRPGSDVLRESIVWVPGLQGSPVPTSRIMSLYIRQFEEEFSRTHVRLIDATEGGALLQKTEVMPLETVLNRFGNPVDEIPHRFASLLPRSRDRSQLDAQLARFIDALHGADSQARQGLRLAQSLANRVPEGMALRNTPEWQALDDCFSAIYRSNELKIVLEQALFSAIYQFIQKERLDQVDLRRAKYENYFHSLLAVLPHYQEKIQHVTLSLQTAIKTERNES